MRIAYNQTNPALRHVPVYLYNVARQPVLGAVPIGAQFELSLDGASWQAFSGTWTEKSGGVYDALLTQSETVAFSFVWLKILIPGAEPVQFVVDIGDRTVQGETNALARRFPIFLTDVTNIPIQSLNLNGASQVQIGVNSAALVDVGGTITEVGGVGNGQGGYYYEATIPEVSTLGYDVLKVFPTGLPNTRYVYAWNVVTPGAGPLPTDGDIIITLITPISSISKTTPIVIDVYSTVAPLRRAWINASYAGFLPDDMVNNSVRFGAAYQGSTNQRTNITNGYRYTLLRDGGWPGTPAIDVHAVDTFGNGDEP